MCACYDIISYLYSGIDTQHPYFYGRALWGFDAVDGANSRRTDDHGHGTHVAGIIYMYICIYIYIYRVYFCQ